MKDAAEKNGIFLGKMELPELVRIAHKKGLLLMQKMLDHLEVHI